MTSSPMVKKLRNISQAGSDLVVLDVMMPKLAYGVCQELRKQSSVPIIMLTALGDVLTESLDWRWC